MADKIYCALAYSGASVSHEAVKPCCNLYNLSDNKIWGGQRTISNLDLNHAAIVDIRTKLSNGEWPASCTNCSNAEDAGYDSMRTRWNNRAQTDGVPETFNSIIEFKDIVYLDLTVDTVCNSKCMMCGPGASSFWEDEHHYVWGDDSARIEVYPSNRINLTNENLQTLAEQTQNLQHISFIGGEPTVSDLHFNFLNLLVASGRSRNISLSYVTNLTGITSRLLEIWDQFKHVSLTASIDGYKAVNEYIRYPISWDKTITTLEKASKHNISITVSCTVSVFNCLHINELLEWWDEYGKKFPNNNFILNRVTHNEFNNLSVLSNEYRLKGIAALNNIMETKKNTYVANCAKQVIGYLQEPQQVSQQLISDLRTLIMRSDKFRKRSIEDFIPGLLSEVNRIYNTYTPA